MIATLEDLLRELALALSVAGQFATLFGAHDLLFKASRGIASVASSRSCWSSHCSQRFPIACIARCRRCSPAPRGRSSFATECGTSRAGTSGASLRLPSRRPGSRSRAG